MLAVPLTLPNEPGKLTKVLLCISFWLRLLPFDRLFVKNRFTQFTWMGGVISHWQCVSRETKLSLVMDRICCPQLLTCEWANIWFDNQTQIQQFGILRSSVNFVHCRLRQPSLLHTLTFKCMSETNRQILTAIAASTGIALHWRQSVKWKHSCNRSALQYVNLQKQRQPLKCQQWLRRRAEKAESEAILENGISKCFQSIYTKHVSLRLNLKILIN